MSVELHFPDLVPREGSQIYPVQRGYSAQAQSGEGAVNADLEEYQRLAVNFTPAIWGYSTTKLAQWLAFMRDSSNGRFPFWLKLPLPTTIIPGWMVPCGPPGDGSRTTFPLPCSAAPGASTFVDGVPTASTLHTYANLLTSDDACNAVAALAHEAESGGSWSVVTPTRSIVMARQGSTSVKCVPSDGVQQTGVVTDSTTQATVIPGEDYTACVSVWCGSAVNHYVMIDWYTSAPAYISTTTGSANNSTGWQDLVVTGTAPGTAAYARVGIKQAASTETYYAGCFALCPGDYDRYHLRSLCPGAIEFSSAPSEGERVRAILEANSSAYRLLRGNVPSAGISSQISLFRPGRAEAQTFRFIEQVEQAEDW